MKRLALILALAIALAGCAGKSVLEGGTSITASIQNPVTREQQAAVEASYGVVASAALNYSRLRRCRAGETESATNYCSRWSVVQKLMKADAVAYKQLTNLRAFMANNQTVNAIGAYNAAIAALRDLKATAFVNGIVTQ